ncbi:MAG: chromosomal replication initiator protein DnaA [Clostridiales bacterium]|nr:chromosomal replication initiator protein DnaA [Clostridiales bacterium]
MNELETIWQEMLSTLEIEVNSLGFDVWIKPLRPIRIEEDVLIVASPTPASKAEVIAKYLPLFKEALRSIDGAPKEISFISEDEANDPSAVVKGVTAVGTADENVQPDTDKRKYEPSTINPKYNFENFVVGGCNRMAYAAAKAVSENPGQVYNPLFIYGGVGLGKTHLMQAIGNAVKMSETNLKVLYVSSETFLNEFVESIRNAKGVNNQAFRDKYRGVDLLMIDDVQFISKKPSTQEEIFHTFEALQTAGKQMVFASDRLPQDIPDLDSRVRSRFASSLVVDVQAPDLETRIAILQRKAQDAKVNISVNMLEYIAERVSSNIREMEGVLTKVIFMSKLYERRVDLAICQEALNDYRVQECDEITADEIIDCTCRYFNVAKSDVIGKKKNKEIVEPRQIAMYIINELVPLPLEKIGECFGREHTTVIHARDKISGLIASDSKVKTAVNDIKAIVLRK